MSNWKWWIPIGLVASVVASFLAFLNGVRAEEKVQQGHGVICDTVQEVEHFAQLGGGVRAVEEINKAEKNACALLVIAFVRGKGVKDIRTNSGMATITEILVMAYEDKGWHDIKPMMQYTLFPSNEEDAFLPIVEVTWKPEFGQSPQDYLKWFQSAQTTPQAFARFGWHSCCSHADRYVTQFRSNATGDEWWYLKDGKSWERIPAFIIHWEDDPTMRDQLKAEGVLFIYQSTGALTCFWPPQTGG